MINSLKLKLRIIQILYKSEVPLTTYRISERLGLQESRIKTHLKSLLKAGIIVKKNVNGFIYYDSVDYPVCYQGLIVSMSNEPIIHLCPNHSMCNLIRKTPIIKNCKFLVKKE
ncbi:MAG: winged helix-turn-helix domain-containing protein [Candidatus Hodarchaeales archaeon]